MSKLRSMQRSLGLVPKQHQPMSPGMERIARQQDRQAPAPLPDHGLGAAIESAVQQTVDRRIEEALEQQRQQLLLDQQFNKPARQLPPPAAEKKHPASISTVVHKRDSFGRIYQLLTSAEGRDLQLLTTVTRDGLGVIISSRTEPLDNGYVPGTPRKIYGNHLVNPDES